VVASGALGFDGKGYWPWERPLVWCGLIKPEFFTVVTRTLTRHPCPGNLRWWKPLSCIRLIPGGSVNKVDLTNPGIDWWYQRVNPRLNHERYPLVGSISGTRRELIEMADILNYEDVHLVGLEVNTSYPKTGHPMKSTETTEAVIEMVKAVVEASRYPVIVKVSVDQDYCAIAEGLTDLAEAISLNSVPWKTIFPSSERSPLWKLEEKVGGGGGDVSGKPAQWKNWQAVRELAQQGALPVIGPSIMTFEDVARVRALGARAVSFDAIHLRTPWRATSIVEAYMRLHACNLD
jgi:dihydroorotate dehydrogenase